MKPGAALAEGLEKNQSELKSFHLVLKSKSTTDKKTPIKHKVDMRGLIRPVSTHTLARMHTHTHNRTQSQNVHTSSIFS